MHPVAYLEFTKGSMASEMRRGSSSQRSLSWKVKASSGSWS